MGDPAERPAEDGGREPGARDPAEDLADVRAILVGPEQRALEAMRARLGDPAAQARQVAAVLPQALQLRALDTELARALAPPVEDAITASIHRNPKPLADALFPVMGPAIRKAVAASLVGMVESFNRTLEHSLSWRSLRWRVEAFRTGRSFGEVVLLHTLLFRVEQVFLIDRTSGLLLQHVQAGVSGVQDADMVSGMLTAIRDFVGDSFSVADKSSLDAFQVGDLTIWIEQGPRAIIAAVIRGTPPQQLRASLQEALETIHLQLADALHAFDGDASPFEMARPELDACLRAEYRRDEKPRRLVPATVAALVLGALAAWAGLTWRERQLWNGYLEMLRAEPGIVVVSAGRTGGKFVVSGLRDERAARPDDLLRQTALDPAEVEGRWRPYQALEPPFVLAAAREALQPPASATLDLADGVLRVSGQAPAAWLLSARERAPLVAGVVRLDAERCPRRGDPQPRRAHRGRGPVVRQGHQPAGAWTGDRDRCAQGRPGAAGRPPGSGGPPRSDYYRGAHRHRRRATRQRAAQPRTRRTAPRSPGARCFHAPDLVGERRRQQPARGRGDVGTSQAAQSTSEPPGRGRVTVAEGRQR